MYVLYNKNGILLNTVFFFSGCLKNNRNAVGWIALPTTMLREVDNNHNQTCGLTVGKEAHPTAEN
ncbi:MAG: hypothetical protein IJV56_00690 [Neisseriaceae bacterium]|nr:hypothetical protein [Neisseriaceae bacterium]